MKAIELVLTAVGSFVVKLLEKVVDKLSSNDCSKCPLIESLSETAHTGEDDEQK